MLHIGLWLLRDGIIPRLCGLDSIGVYTGFAEEGELEEAGATFVFRSIPELAAFLARNAGNIR